ncbi:MAG: tetratricopeptide repeat protein [Kofleriaceae bacterium]
MDALLAELRPRRGSRLAIAAAAVAAVSIAAFLLGSARSVPPTCDGASARLVGVWDPPRQVAVHAAFAASQLPYADAAWRGASAQLDDYTRAWTAMHREACRATHVEGRQSAALLDLRMACLERRRNAVGALTQLWASGVTAEALQAAVAGPRGLPAIDECADARALTQRTPLPSEPGALLAVAVTRARIDAVTALRLAARPEAKRAATAARAAADATGWSQVRAEAALAEGEVLSDLEIASTAPVLIEAARLAGEARDDRLAAEALIDLVHHLAEDARDATRALLVADLAEGVLLRAGDAPRLRVQLLRFRGTALLLQNRYRDAAAMFTIARDRAAAAFGARDWEAMSNVAELARVAEAQGDYAGARRLGDEVVAAAIERFGPDHPRVASLLNNLAIAVDDGGDHEAAIAYHRRALAIKDKVLGPDNASTATTLNNLGILEIMFGHLDEGQARLERALVVREHLLGPDHPFVANTLDNLAVAQRMRGHTTEALALLDRALAIEIRANGPSHVSVAPTLVKLGAVWSATGDDARAGDYYRRALEIRRVARGPKHPATLAASNLVASALVARGRCDEARPLLAANLAILESATGRPTGNVAAALALVAECDLALGQLPRAAEQAERALTLREAGHATAAELGGVRWLVGRARWALGQREAGIAAVHQAARELDGDATVSRQLAAARAWLTTRER